MLFTVLVWVSGAFACPASEWRDAADVAVDDFVRDPASLDASVAVARERLGCVEEVLTPADAAKAHWVETLAAFNVDQPVYQASLCSVKNADPEFDPGEAAPSSSDGQHHPLRLGLNEANCVPRSATIEAPPQASLFVDGTRATAVPGNPASRPYVLQVSRPGSPLATTYVGLGALAPVLVPPTAAPPRSNGQRRAGLVMAGVGAGVAAIGTVVILRGSSAFGAVDNCGWSEPFFQDRSCELERYTLIGSGMATLGVATGLVGLAMADFKLSAGPDEVALTGRLTF